MKTYSTIEMKLFTLNPNVLFYDNYKNHSSASSIYPTFGKAIKGIRSLINRYSPKLSPLLYTREFRRSGLTEDCIIIFDSQLTVAPANYIKRRYPNLRVIYWFWNHIYNPKVLTELDPRIERWSYDPVDCMDYNLNFNTQFYFSELATVEVAPNVEQYDCIFAGAVKGRQAAIDNCQQMIAEAGLTSRFFIATGFKHGHYKTWTPYDLLLQFVKRSKCVIDLLPSTQHGMSLRPLEALFFEKKLITNYNRITEEKFYNASNIFIIGKDDPKRLVEFVNTPYNPVNRANRDYYTFQSWLTRFTQI